jgi:hypothetical protein
MSKQKAFSNPAFEISTQNSLEGSFNLAPQVNNFNAIFDTKPLDENESRGIEKLLVEYFLPGRVSEDQAQKDLNQLKNITAEIKAISKQSVVLTGERIQKAREILKPYRDGAFAQWLEFSFGSKRTAYNMLSYYQLYSELPNYTLKENFKKLSHRVAYLLASKDADLEKKAKIIENYSNASSDELIMLIQDTFPTDAQDGRRKSANNTLLDSLEIALKKLLKRRAHLSDDNLDQLAKLRELINEILDSKRVESAIPVRAES